MLRIQRARSMYVVYREQHGDWELEETYVVVQDAE